MDVTTTPVFGSPEPSDHEDLETDFFKVFIYYSSYGCFLFLAPIMIVTDCHNVILNTIYSHLFHKTASLIFRLAFIGSLFLSQRFPSGRGVG